MIFEELIKKGTNINITVGTTELFQFGKQIAFDTAEAILEKYNEKLYTRKEVLEKYKICSATLWRWQKLGLIEYEYKGNRIYYPASGLKNLSNK